MFTEPNPVASRWLRLATLKRTTAPDHEWCKTYDRLVSNPVLDAHASGTRWDTRGSESLLRLLEERARHFGLIDDTEPYTVTTGQALAELVATANL